MRINLLGIGNQLLLSARIKTLDEAEGLLNISALARMLGVHRSTFLSKCAALGLDQAVLFYVKQRKLKEVS